MALIFHDDCSSLGNWTAVPREGVVDYGQLATDGSCIYMTQEYSSGKYYAVGYFSQACAIGTGDFEAEFQIKPGTRSPGASIEIAFLFGNSTHYVIFAFMMMSFGTYGSLGSDSVNIDPVTVTLSTDALIKCVRANNKLELYLDGFLVGQYEAEDIGTIDIENIYLSLNKSTYYSDESATKVPAVYDIQVYAVDEDPIIDDVIPSYPPASYIKLWFQAGDSELYDMGIFYADKTRFRVGDPGAKVNARNSVGKYLRDQTYDERNNYSVMRLDDLLKKILTGAGITDFYVAPNSTQLGMQFAPNKSILDGIEEILAYAPGWIIREEVTGRVVIGPKDDAEFTQPSRYTFQRDRDIFSREQIKDDQLIYGRVCVHTTDFVVKVYRAVTSALGWLPPAQKTYYQSVPDGTTSQEAAALATELADAMADSGEIETFVCPFRPQIIPGDEAEILDSDGATFLGVITQVKHDFGLSGFYTNIVVDSGGRIGRPRFKDLVNAIDSVTTISHKL